MPENEITNDTETDTAWVTKTPSEMVYRLMMENRHEGEWLQDVALTRAEYIELKTHLAKMRGLLPE